MGLPQMPQVRRRITQGKDWAAIADRQLGTIFKPDSLDMSSIQAFADTIDQLEDLVPEHPQNVRFCPAHAGQIQAAGHGPASNIASSFASHIPDGCIAWETEVAGCNSVTGLLRSHLETGGQTCMHALQLQRQTSPVCLQRRPDLELQQPAMGGIPRSSTGADSTPT